MNEMTEMTDSFKKEIYLKMQNITNYDVLYDILYDFIMIHKVPFTKNNNGIFINLSLLDMEILIKLNEILTSEGHHLTTDDNPIDKELDFYKDSLDVCNEGKLKEGIKQEQDNCTLNSIQKSILQFSYN